MFLLLLFVSVVFGQTYEDYEYEFAGHGQCILQTGQSPTPMEKPVTGPNGCRIECNHKDDCFGYNEWGIGTNNPGPHCMLWLTDSGIMHGPGPAYPSSSMNSPCMLKRMLRVGWGKCQVTGIQVLSRPIAQHFQVLPYTMAENDCRWECAKALEPTPGVGGQGRRCGGYNHEMASYSTATEQWTGRCVLWYAHPNDILGSEMAGYTDDTDLYMTDTNLHFLSDTLCRQRTGLSLEVQDCSPFNCADNGEGTGYQDWGLCHCDCDAPYTGYNCGTVPPSCGPEDCNNHGTATGGTPPNCDCACEGHWDGATCNVCEDGWGGPDCTQPACDDATDCSGHGTATGFQPDCTCECDSSGDWTGADCSEPTCPNEEGDSCGGLDFMALQASPATCCPQGLRCYKRCDYHSACLAECPPDWDCAKPCDELLDCGDHGTAAGEDGNCACQCDDLWEGDLCTEPKPQPPFGMTSPWDCYPEPWPFQWVGGYLTFEKPTIGDEVVAPLRMAIDVGPGVNAEVQFAGSYMGYPSPDGSCTIGDLPEYLEDYAEVSIHMSIDCGAGCNLAAEDLDFYLCSEATPCDASDCSLHGSASGNRPTCTCECEPAWGNEPDCSVCDPDFEDPDAPTAPFGLDEESDTEDYECFLTPFTWNNNIQFENPTGGQPSDFVTKLALVNKTPCTPLVTSWNVAGATAYSSPDGSCLMNDLPSYLEPEANPSFYSVAQYDCGYNCPQPNPEDFDLYVCFVPPPPRPEPTPPFGFGNNWICDQADFSWPDSGGSTLTFPNPSMGNTVHVVFVEHEGAPPVTDMSTGSSNMGQSATPDGNWHMGLLAQTGNYNPAFWFSLACGYQCQYPAASELDIYLCYEKPECIAGPNELRRRQDMGYQPAPPSPMPSFPTFGLDQDIWACEEITDYEWESGYNGRGGLVKFHPSTTAYGVKWGFVESACAGASAGSMPALQHIQGNGLYGYESDEAGSWLIDAAAIDAPDALNANPLQELYISTNCPDQGRYSWCTGPDVASLDLYFCYNKELEMPILTEFKMYLESDTHDELAKSLTNIAGFMAQALWETGEWKACDENNWDPNGAPEAACTQHQDGYLYHELTSGEFACEVDTNMIMEGTVMEGNDGPPMSCHPTDHDGVTAGCCWWGRGAVQTTGPSHYGAFQHYILDARPNNEIDVCQVPQDLCNYPDLKFASGFFYWAERIQTDLCWAASLDAYVADFDVEARPDKMVPSAAAWNWDSYGSIQCETFAIGVGGRLNNGYWNKYADANWNRVEYFKDIMASVVPALQSYTEPDANAPVCSGNPAVDTILHQADVKTVSLIDSDGSIYPWSGFCEALREFSE